MNDMQEHMDNLAQQLVSPNEAANPIDESAVAGAHADVPRAGHGTTILGPIKLESLFGANGLVHC